MEESRQGKRVDSEARKPQTATITPTNLDKERIREEDTQAIKDGETPEASPELAITLKQIETYFTKQTRTDDLEALSFSLRHLFSRVDFLYRHALPGLEDRVSHAQKQGGNLHQETLQRQRIWLQLQTINRTLDRMAPLCHLLSDTIECLLDTLDDEEIWLRTFDEEDTVLLEQVKIPATREIEDTTQEQEIDVISLERWDKAVNVLMDQLLLWQELHHRLTPFPQQFSRSQPPDCNLNELDTAFTMLLDSAGAIFGDILPNFRLFKPEDREEIGALLFDLMQQSDQMLMQFEVTLEPLARLLRFFADVGENT